MKYTIQDHWDTGGKITSKSLPKREFLLWHYFAVNDPDWTGDEFTLEDFEDYIKSLDNHERLR